MQTAAEAKPKQSQELRLFLNSFSSDYTKTNYKIYLDKYLQTVGYSNGLPDLLSRTPRKIEKDLIEFIISLKERGCKYSTITNYVKPVIGVCSVNDITLNNLKINRFIPQYVKNRKTRAYSIPEIQRLLDIADERMRVVILLASSCGLRIGSIPELSIGSCEPVQDLFKITVYEGEPESYVTFCSNECRKAIDAYLSMRGRYGEDIENRSAPLIREQFDKRDPFAAAHPKRIKRITLRKRLAEMAEAAGLRIRTPLQGLPRGSGQRKEIPICNGFRYHYITTLVNSGLKTEHRFLLEGHNLKFNDMFYVHVSHDDLLQSYLLAHDNLLIDQSHKLTKQISVLQEKHDRLDKVLARVDALEKELGITLAD